MLKDYLLQNIIYRSALEDAFNDLENNLVEDSSGYIYVDGEEGDYGIVKYFTKEGSLVITRVIEGGDSEYTELTSLGKKMLMDCLIEYITKLED